MKTIIDSLKEIIQKDASTQTDPVIIIDNEEEMTIVVKVGESDEMNLLLNKRDSFSQGIRRKTREELLWSKRRIDGNKSDDESNIMSGKEHINEGTKMKEQEQIKSDNSFLEKCKNYVLKVYPEEIDSSGFYSDIEGSLRYPIINHHPDFNVERFIWLIEDLFGAVRDGYIDNEKGLKDRLVLKAAGIYKVCAEGKDIQDFMQERNEANFTDRGLLKDTIQKHLAEVTNIELAGEVFEILDNSN